MNHRLHEYLEHEITRTDRRELGEERSQPIDPLICGISERNFIHSNTHEVESSVDVRLLRGR